MQKRVMLIVSVAGVLLLPTAYAAYAQTAPSPAGPATGGPVTGSPATGGAASGSASGSTPAASPVALAPVTAADVQAFISNPAAFIAASPASGPELTQRIRQLLIVAAQIGQLTEVLAGLNTIGSIPGISPQQLAAIVAGANAAAADFAAAQNLAAQRAIQVAVASNPALSGAQQALAAAATPQTQVPATADLGPAGGLAGGGQTSAIGGAGSTSGSSGGSSSASSSGTGTSSGSSSGIASSSGSFSGATGGGSSSRNNDDDSGSGTTIDTSPITRT